MRPAMYIFLNKGLGMSTGKAAAQAAHAAVEAYRITPDNNTKRVWHRGGHYMKLAMECRDREHLLDTERYLNDRGFKTALIIDEGHTEVDAITPTALGVEVLDKDDAHVAATFSSFDLYTEPEPSTNIVILESSRPLHYQVRAEIMDAVKDGRNDDAREIIRKWNGLPTLRSDKELVDATDSPWTLPGETENVAQPMRSRWRRMFQT